MTDIYHVFIRGVGRQLIFEDDADHRKFLDLLERYSTKLSISIFAYVLMDNHVHLLLRASLASMSDFMHRLETAYAHYFNVRHDRAGHLFQGRFGSQGIVDDDHFLAALCYIHRNPVKAGLSDGPDYLWSSYGEYLGHHRICDTFSAMNLLEGKDPSQMLDTEPIVDDFLDIAEGVDGRRRMDEVRAIEIAAKTLGEDWRASLFSAGRASRDESIRRLKSSGLSIREIERLTGIGRGIIQRV